MTEVNNHSKRVKCVFCGWERPAFYINRNGRVCVGYSMLQEHMMADHENKYYEILGKLEMEDDLHRRGEE